MLPLLKTLKLSYSFNRTNKKIRLMNKYILTFLTIILSSTSIAAENKTPVESPWMIVPLLSSDPKLGTSLGVMGGYLHKFDEQSTQSMFALMGTYSSTDSWVSGMFGQMFFDKDKQKLTLGYVGGEIRNDYDDFLGSGISAQTTDNLKAQFIRYSHSVGNHWYLGAQFVSSNYAIGANGDLSDWLALISLTGFDSAGLGLVAEYDTRDNLRNPKTGQIFEFNNIAYRESLGGDQSFDVYHAKYSQYLKHGNNNVFAWQFSGRWTSDAPIGGYSSVQLRGYVKGNYLAPHYTHFDFEDRISFNETWGMSVFAGLACLYEEASNCNDSEDLYASAGAGVIYVLKPEAGIVMRAELAKGEADEYVWYLKMGNSF